MIIDAHQDLAWNMLNFGRDYTRSVTETRQLEREKRGLGREKIGDTLLGWPEYQTGRVAVIFATLFAAPARKCLGEWDRLCYRDFDEAHARYQVQLDVYHRLVDEHPDKFRLIQTRDDLHRLLREWDGRETEPCPVGLVILMEGAEGVREVPELEEWFARGVRLIGPAWAGTRFCGGTGEPGPLTREGFALLEAMAGLGIGLDLSHMDEKAALQALDAYPGVLFASHANARTLLKGTSSNRFLSDRVIRGIVERDGVIGVVPYNRFLRAGWQKSDGKQAVTLYEVAAQIDYICQLAGDAYHVGFGTDFDGGFGWQSVPAGIDTIADLHKVAPLLAEKGYADDDLAAIFSRNWQTILENTLPNDG